MTTSRRDLCLSMPALALFAKAIAASAQEATPAKPTGTPPELAHGHVFHYDQLPVHKNSNGGESRAVTHGALPTGEGVEIHITTLPAGQMPHPPHKHLHEEFIMIREGHLTWISGGENIAAGPGDILYNGSNQIHSLKNTGTTPANYFVIAIGPNLR